MYPDCLISHACKSKGVFCAELLYSSGTCLKVCCKFSFPINDKNSILNGLNPPIIEVPILYFTSFLGWVMSMRRDIDHINTVLLLCSELNSFHFLYYLDLNQLYK